VAPRHALVFQPHIDRKATPDMRRAGTQRQQRALVPVVELQIPPGRRALRGHGVVTLAEADTGEGVQDVGAGAVEGLGEGGHGGHDGKFSART
jgi:hypothetical protein